jgi:trans-2,3-dihydro-3-hydroxyanthranilate isomerase
VPTFAYTLIDVFTPTPFRGNPLAVFADARGIDEALMPRIAAELNLSETTFVLPSPRPDCDFRVRIFTPRVELPMAGHPTIGTAWVLDHGARVTFLEGVGPIAVERASTPGGRPMWVMSQPWPTWGGRGDDAEVALALGLTTDDLIGTLPLDVVSCGVPFLFVPLRNLETLGRARARPDLWSALADRLEAHGVYCFTLAAGEDGVDVRSRMFAPNIGVAEDPATGGASGPLGCYLVRNGVVRPAAPARVRNVQGVEMGRRSEIHIEIEGGPEAITAVRVGGECTAVGRGSIEVGD